MEKTENKALEVKELLPSDLNKISGGGIVQIDYCKGSKNTTGYYLSKNEKFYKSFEVASETDKAFGGDGIIKSKTTSENGPRNFSDIGYEQYDD